MNRLDIALRIFGWQGGTIHQANEEASNCLERPVDLLALSNQDFASTMAELADSYPRWIAFHKAEMN